jgi:acyl-CoA synthetase (AMP-forming)/AMP-acid ligase II
VVALADPQTMAQHPDAAGRFLDWVEAQVVDEHDRPLPEGQSGILRLRGEGVAQGYYGIAPDDHAQRGFRDGWCYPGDMARIASGRLLYIEGRIDDIVTLGGPKINVAAIETLLASHPGVREAAVFGTSGSLGKQFLVAAVVADESVGLAALARHYRDGGGKHGDILRLVRVPRLPRNAAGKVLKQELRQHIRARMRRPG